MQPGRIMFCLVFVIAMLFSVQAAAQEGYEAPVNEEFSGYLEHAARQVPAFASGEEKPGYIPSPLDRSHLRNKRETQILSEARANGIPVSYDLRTTGKLTAVKDQGSCGSCWTFAAMGSLESNLLPGENKDFSEENLKNRHGFDPLPCSGGNNDMALAYFARWSGPYEETEDPFVEEANVRLPVTVPSALAVKHLQEAILIPGRSSSSDNDKIKQAILTYGAAHTNFYWKSDRYDSVNHSYYCSSCTSSNHAVAVVGWDDAYSANNFTKVPPGDGAFIVKNSWGESWGENGYFYVSYYDSTFARYESMVFNGAAAVTNYDHIYQHDPLGQTSSYGYGDEIGWFANLFTATNSEQLKAVSFYTASADSSYETYIYTDVTSSPVTGTLSASVTGVIVEPGYHTVLLPSPVILRAGCRFSVVVKLTTPGYNYPVPLEKPISGYSSEAAAKYGESYISHNGTVWTDMTSKIQNTNVCLKAFTGNLGTAALYAAYPDAGIWKNDGSDWAQITTGAPDLMTTSGTDLYATFAGGGIWKYNGADWSQATSNNPDKMVVSGTTLYGTFTGNGIWKFDGTEWNQVTPNNPDDMVIAGGSLYGTFGTSGVWKFDGSDWNQVTTNTPTQMVGTTNALYGIFAGAGIWKYEGSEWTQVTSNTPDQIISGGTSLYGTFAGSGIWKYNGTDWANVTPNNPQQMTATSSAFYGVFTGTGIWKHDGTTWSQVTANDPLKMVAGE